MLPMTDPPRQPTKYDMTIFYLRHYDLCRAAERQHGKHYLELSAEQQRALRAVVAAGMESPRNEGSRRKQQVRKERLGKRTAKRDAVKARADIERQRTEFGRLLPNLQTEPRITIRVHPGLVPMLEEDLASLDLELTGTVAVTSAALEPGDVRVAWENGSFKRDTRAILASMQDALAQLGLLTPIDITQERRMELAE